MIDWSSAETHVLLNPRLPASDRETLLELQRGVPPLDAHIWIASSGTSGALKLVALSKRAILAAAEGANRHLESTASDVWLSVLPTFHVGGLGILARAALSGARVVTAAWDPHQFAATAKDESATLSSLVPAQVRDLVSARIEAPSSLRAIVVGGGALREALYRDGRGLGWPLLPSYGLTEACSQVATAKGDSPELRLLPHLECRIADERIVIRSPALLSGYALLDRGVATFVDPKVDGWFTTEDRGRLVGETLEVLGREGEFVKIGGESVDLKRLDAILDELRGTEEVALVALEDERLGHVIVLAAEGEAESLVQAFNKVVMPYERIREVYYVDSMPRTALGKVRRKELEEKLASLE